MKKIIDEKMSEIKKRALNRKATIKASAKKFKREVKKSTNTAIVAAFGFLMALAWRDLITEYVNELSAMSPVQGKFVSALIITVISVAGILIVTKVFSTED